MVAHIAGIFRPAELAVVTTVDCAGDAPAWGVSISPPPGYVSTGRTVQELHTGGCVTFLSLAAGDAASGVRVGTADSCTAADCTAAAAQSLMRPASPAGSASSASGALCPPVPQPYQGPPSAYLSDSEEGTLGSDSGDAAAVEEAQLVATKPQPLVALGSAFEEDCQCSEAVAGVMAKYAAVPLPATNATALDAHIGGLIKVGAPNDICLTALVTSSVRLSSAACTLWNHLELVDFSCQAVNCMGADAAPGRHLLCDGSGHGGSPGGGLDQVDAARAPLLRRQVRCRCTHQQKRF
jgi:hypothetical protein